MRQFAEQSPTGIHSAKDFGIVKYPSLLAREIAASFIKIDHLVDGFARPAGYHSYSIANPSIYEIA